MSVTVSSILFDHFNGLDRTLLMFLEPDTVAQLEDDLNQVSGQNISLLLITWYKNGKKCSDLICFYADFKYGTENTKFPRPYISVFAWWPGTAFLIEDDLTNWLKTSAKSFSIDCKVYMVRVQYVGQKKVR